MPYISPMAMKQKDIVALIKDAFPDGKITIEDLRGDEDHYSLRVISSAFHGKSRVQQHQMVYKALKGHMGTTLHAMALKTISKESDHE